MARFRIVRSWKPDDDELLISLLGQEHLVARAIAIKLKRTVNAVRARANHLGLSAARHRKSYQPLARPGTENAI
jgi:hypothetical protein